MTRAKDSMPREESYTHQGNALMTTGERDAALAALARLEEFDAAIDKIMEKAK